jgi:hypothetical protein
MCKVRASCFTVLAGMVLLGAVCGPAGAQCPPPVVPIALQAPSAGDFATGCTEYALEFGGRGGVQGSCGALDFPDGCPSTSCRGGGAERFRCYLMNGYWCAADNGYCIPGKTGNMSGPTLQALAARFSEDTDQREGICYTDYHGNGRRIVNAPVTEPALGSGSNACYQLKRYARCFLIRIPGGGGRGSLSVNLISYITFADSKDCGEPAIGQP